MTATQTTKRVSRTERVRQLLVKRPDLTPKIIAQRAKVDVSIVYDERKKMLENSNGAKLPQVATAKPMTKTAKVRALLAKHPNLNPKQIAKRTGASIQMVYDVKSRLKLKQEAGAKLPNIVSQAKKTAPIRVPVFQELKAEVKAEVKAEPQIKYSERYTKAVDLIADYKLNFNLGSAVAHVLRANTDNRQADIKAAIWYLTNELVNYDK